MSAAHFANYLTAPVGDHPAVLRTDGLTTSTQITTFHILICELLRQVIEE